MAFANPLLLFALAGIAVPVVLHLIMRQRPQRLEFPAVRFVAARMRVNKRRLQLRHWILLALRCLAIGAVAVALARPSVASAAVGRWLAVGALAAGALGLGAIAWLAASREGSVWLARGLGGAAALLGLVALLLGLGAASGKGPRIGDQEAPVAAVLVIDSSPRMEYRAAGRSRREQAADLALRLIRELPPDSQLAILDSRSAGAYFSADRALARTAVERLQTAGVPRPLGELVGEALELAASSPLVRQEVYVFSDLTESAWGRDQGLAERLQQRNEVVLYLFDVGGDEPRNISLGDVRLSAESLPRSGELTIRTEVRAIGVGGPCDVRLELERQDPTLPILEDGRTVLPEAEPRGRRSLTLEPGVAQAVEFTLRIDEPGTHQGRVLIEGADALTVDDVRHFTVVVRDAWPVLLVSGGGASPRFLVDALAPADFQDFACETISQAELGAAPLSKYAVTCLLDPGPLDEAQWLRLEEYVRAGGALWVALGRHAAPDLSFNGEAAQRLLAGPLVRQWRSGGRDMFLTLVDGAHPALGVFRQRATGVDWSALPVLKHWVLDPPADDARTLLGYSLNGHPAVAERFVGAGRVVTMTTPLSDVVDNAGAWNELAFGEDNWPAFVLANELALYLARGGDERLNYLAGESVALANDSQIEPVRYQLFTPGEPPQDVAARDGQVRIGYTEHAGAYRLKGSRDGPVLRGFACNLPEEATRLERLSDATLDERLGAGRFQRASDWDQLERVQGRQRVGAEFFPLLLVLLVGLLAVEQLLANRFYKSEAGAGRAGGTEGASARGGSHAAKSDAGAKTRGAPTPRAPSRSAR